MNFQWWRRGRPEDADESIIDAINKQPVPYRGNYPILVNPRTMPFTHVNLKPDPPSRYERPELHITPPQGRAMLPPPPPQPRPSARARLMMFIETLPLFRDTARTQGWAVFIPPKRQRTTTASALRGIAAYSDKTYRVICSQTESARAALWERHRDYDLREAEYRAKHPLTEQNRM